MADTTSDAKKRDREAPRKKKAWAWHPPLPLAGVPVFVFPPKPVKALKWFLSVGSLWSIQVPFVVLAVVTWFYLQPALERCVTFEAGWMLQMLARNLGLMVLVAGGLHLFFYTFKMQGAEHKYDPRDLNRNDRRYFGQNQVWDNIFWSCASGVTLWTAYEVFFMWGYANDMLRPLDWNAHPVWFALLFVAIPFWNSVHFYFVHRLLHWMPLYRVAHALHHRNVNVGPWSGLSMHPIEHILYLSSVLIHLVVPSHPMHIFFHMQFLTLAAATTHTGFEGLLFKGKTVLKLGAFHHQLHHRYFNCNYGNEYVPCDKWFGSDHDGTPEAVARMKLGRLKEA
jgi:sterol desaturase/sphingolipid hydroxylase (fatty acid hydroxylase superfamily)